VVHAAAIAATSPQLDALINGGMEESNNRCAKIEDVRIDDFVRFCEYAYRGDYMVPPWEEIPLRSSSFGDIGINDYWDAWGAGGISKKKKGKKGKKSQALPELLIEHAESEAIEDAEAEAAAAAAAAEAALVGMSEVFPEAPTEVRSISRVPLRNEFNSRNYLSDSSPKASILQHFEPKPNSAANQNFTPVLLAHARLYCFAHVRLITPLEALTLDKLHKTLLNFKLYAERVGDIIELARYAYSHPDLPDRSDDGTPNDLRKMVVDYIVCEIDTIGKHDEFVHYIEEGGQFVGDFWRLARDHMA
jgi:hypothetical protein